MGRLWVTKGGLHAMESIGDVSAPCRPVFLWSENEMLGFDQGLT